MSKAYEAKQREKERSKEREEERGKESKREREQKQKDGEDTAPGLYNNQPATKLAAPGWLSPNHW
jgi:hypothetical protein